MANMGKGLLQNLGNPEIMTPLCPYAEPLKVSELGIHLESLGVCPEFAQTVVLVIFRAAQVNSASPEPTPGQVRLLRSSVPPLSVPPLSVPLLFCLLLNILVPVP
ncbi:hypothetical protein PAXRUDRAFT_22849 [Paxillus rubicundulus Ve08.2h10]|uniref:Uncharacterized protein n=1 Tax=Paxillus rubicundulus Ve08.2h10 TaxID=930991 RepID=A0A0D0BJE8_9AGAM|nr:hypothetical protein PAXRUDRAFT_22849 [Paxillus rubicundulus Ve08.2h10]